MCQVSSSGRVVELYAAPMSASTTPPPPPPSLLSQVGLLQSLFAYAGVKVHVYALLRAFRHDKRGQIVSGRVGNLVAVCELFGC